MGLRTPLRGLQSGLAATPAKVLEDLMEALDTVGVSMEDWFYHCEECICGRMFTRRAFAIHSQECTQFLDSIE